MLSSTPCMFGGWKTQWSAAGFPWQWESNVLQSYQCPKPVREIRAAFPRLGDSTLLSAFLPVAVLHTWFEGKVLTHPSSAIGVTRCSVSSAEQGCVRLRVCVSGGQEGAQALHYPALLCCFSPRCPPLGWCKALGCVLSECRDMVALCREAGVALGRVKQCKGDVSWQRQGLDELSRKPRW